MVAQAGNKVKVHYKGSLDDGTIFDESSVPLEFTLGSDMVISGFNEGIKGMSVGEKKRFHISAKDAYGYRTDELIIEIHKDNIPDDIVFEVGDTIQFQLAPEHIVNMLVMEIKENSVIFDANHKLADQNLIFDVELICVE